MSAQPHINQVTVVRSGAGAPFAQRAAYGAAAIVLLGALAAAVIAHGHLPLALLGVLGPDVALAVGGGDGLSKGQLHPRAVRLYNALHRLWAPGLLLIAGAAGLAGPGLVILGLAWAFHVSLDRCVGYGLRDQEGFQRVG